MMELKIIRNPTSTETPGRLFVDGQYQADTLELAWRDNATGISCIPPGKYRLGWVKSPRLGRYTLRVHGVPGRSGILIHPANRPEELKGCIAVGKRVAPNVLMESRVSVLALEALVVPGIIRKHFVWLEVVTA
jgi:hypothetical protein